LSFSKEEAHMNFTPRERQTLVIALRCWLNELGYHSLEELRQHYPLPPEPLTPEEVEALIHRLS
jgi:hypothetical protein